MQIISQCVRGDPVTGVDQRPVWACSAHVGLSGRKGETPARTTRCRFLWSEANERAVVVACSAIGQSGDGGDLKQPGGSGLEAKTDDAKREHCDGLPRD